MIEEYIGKYMIEMTIYWFNQSGYWYCSGKWRRPYYYYYYYWNYGRIIGIDCIDDLGNDGWCEEVINDVNQWPVIVKAWFWWYEEKKIILLIGMCIGQLTNDPLLLCEETVII